MITLHNRLADALGRSTTTVLPTLARLIFAGVLLTYFIRSGLTKLGDGVLGLFNPSAGAYIQVFPKAVEAAGYDVSQLGLVQKLVVLAGTWGELILPVAILIGLGTRLAASGMIVFVLVQSIVDVTGHGVGGKDLGAWFDASSASLIMDQRAFWIFLLLVLVFKGGGPLSLDRLLRIK